MRHTLPVLLFLVVPVLGQAADVQRSLPPPAGSFDFDREIAPILERACLRCHGPDKQKAKLRIDSHQALLAGGQSGPAVVLGKSAESLLAQSAGRLDEDMAMPPDDDEALSPKEVSLLRAWIDAGAKFPRDLISPSPIVEKNASQIAAKLPSPAPFQVDFLRDVRPVFETFCFECHGPKKQEADFRLDHKATVFGTNGRAPAVIAGKSADSVLMHLVAGVRTDVVMPPKGHPAPSKEQLGILRAWIDQGAVYPDAASVTIKNRRDHWAFRAPAKPAVPAVRDNAWVKTPIDSFVLARLEQEKLAPAPEADRITLLRRLYLDLIGLPPTVAQVDAFLSDASPKAYDKVVDNLLKSPHYGERWARHWLDAARYADSDGFEKDKSRTMHFYRDWVIDAFNRDLPYDRFIIEQLAGDLLPGATQSQIVATGFLRNSMINEEGGVDPEQFRMDALFDRMDAIGKSMMGLTLGCAQCHTHKFDPISHDEYYKILAFFNNDDEAIRTVFTPEEERKRAEIFRRTRAIESELLSKNPDWRARLARWEKTVSVQPAWTPITAPFIDGTTAGQKFLIQKDGSYLAQGFAPIGNSPQVVIETAVTGIRALRLEALTDPNLPHGGPGRSYKGLFALSEIVIEAAPAGAPDQKETIKIAKATADFEEKAGPLDPKLDDKKGGTRQVGPVTFAIDGDETTAWGIDAGPGRRNADRKAVFSFDKPIAFPKGTILTVTLKQRHGGWNADDHHNNNLGRFRFSITTDNNAVADPLPKNVRGIIATVPANRRSSADVAAIFSYYRTTVQAWAKDNERIESLWRAHPDPTTALVLKTRPGGRTTHLLKRGDFLKPGKAVTPGVLSAFHPMPAGAPPTRLTFANWLADKRSPTTARVAVNRMWQAYFGTGIVATSEDFGTQSEPPSHPELLDWLATWLMDRNWRQKDLHRLIVSSATYKQSSRVTPALLAVDPSNRLLARGPRFRVEGEVVRDIFLAAGGLLNRKVGGRSVMPPAPSFLFVPPASYSPFPWIDESDSEKYRRGLYTFRRRSTPFPMLATFDTPNGETACARRLRSNTPLQALVTLNEPMSMEAAQALARRMMEHADDERRRIEHGWRRVLGRPPRNDEVETLQRLLANQRRRLVEGWANAWGIITGTTNAPANLPRGANPTELAAYTIVARAILNLDEAITKE